MERVNTLLVKFGCENLYDIVKVGYAKFDESHGYDHIVKVLNLLERITPNPTRLEVCAAAVHDIVDPKYNGGDIHGGAEQHREKLRRELAALGYPANDVIEIITHMSWSAANAGEDQHIRDDIETARKHVQIADWLTSIGRDGLVKSYIYNRDRRGEADPAACVVALYHSRLYKYRDMVTAILPAAAALAAELHDEMTPISREHVLELVGDV